MYNGLYNLSIVQDINNWLTQNKSFQDLTYSRVNIQLKETLVKSQDNPYFYDIEFVPDFSNCVCIQGKYLPVPIPFQYVIPNFISECDWQVGNKLEITGWFLKIIEGEIILGQYPQVESFLDWLPCFNSNDKMQLINFNQESKHYLFSLQIHKIDKYTNFRLGNRIEI